MSADETKLVEQIFQQSFAAHERAKVLRDEAALDPSLTAALLRHIQTLNCAANELHARAIGCPPPKPAP
jgi:hypothetical protein